MTNYRLVAGVQWVIERFTIILTDRVGNVRTLRYPEAAVWDLLSRGYPFAKVVSLTAHIASLDVAAADTLVRSSVNDWVESGFLERA